MPEAPEVEIDSVHESIHETVEREGGGFLRRIALSTALLAAFAAVASLQAGATVNEALVLKMEATELQASASDQWAYYQAKGIKAAVQEAVRESWLAADKAAPARLDETIQRYTREQEEIKKDAEDKERARDDIWIAPPGMPGYQTLCASMLALIDENELTLQHLVRHCAERPARLFNLYPRKGVIAPGADADLVILDPARRFEVRDADQYSKADYTTLAGRSVTGLIEQVLLRGRTISREGKCDSAPGGRFVRP